VLSQWRCVSSRCGPHHLAAALGIAQQQAARLEVTDPPAHGGLRHTPAAAQRGLRRLRLPPPSQLLHSVCSAAALVEAGATITGRRVPPLQNTFASSRHHDQAVQISGLWIRLRRPAQQSCTARCSLCDCYLRSRGCNCRLDARPEAARGRDAKAIRAPPGAPIFARRTCRRNAET